MELGKLLDAVRGELQAAGVSAEGVSASLAFSAKKDRDGAVELDFVDTASMSKPRPEEIHRLELTLTASPSKPEPDVHDSPFETDVPISGGKELGKGPARLHVPPALPPERRTLK